MAGWGTRMRPHTYSKPKSLISVAGKATLGHLLDMFKTLPNPDRTEYIFIVDPFLGMSQIPEFVKQHDPEINAHVVVQREMKGQSHALWIGHEYAHGPTLAVFADTLIKTDFSFLKDNFQEAAVWVKPVPDPRRFGVVELGKDEEVVHLIEKPQTMENNLVVVGCYYLPKGEDLMQAIEDQMGNNISLAKEYYLADAVNLLLDRGLKMRIQKVETWLDTGTIDSTLETNRYLLENNRPEINQSFKRENVIVDPVFIHPDAIITNSVIGPYASIGPHCKIIGSHVEDSILEEGVQLTDAALKGSLVGKCAEIKGRSTDTPIRLNIGDYSSLIL